MFYRALTNTSLRSGARELASRDPDLARVLQRVGYPPIWGRRPGFPALVRIILEQQVSLRSAEAMYRRLEAHLGGITPAAFQRIGTSGLRRLGVTRQKAAYLHGLATRLVEGTSSHGAWLQPHSMGPLPRAAPFDDGHSAVLPRRTSVRAHAPPAPLSLPPNFSCVNRDIAPTPAASPGCSCSE